MTRPEPLQKGDTIALLAPSGPGKPALLAPSVQALEKLGLRVKIMDSCRSRYEYLAAPDMIRAGDINTAFADQEVQGILAWRGGYGAQRILPYIDYELIRYNPKVFAGYSDITALHIAITQIAGMITYHAPMPASELAGDADPFTVRAFKRFIFHNAEPTPRLLRNPDHLSMRTIVPGCAEGLLIGGNLSLLASSVGTPFEIDTFDRILFIEEINEEPYRIDRMLLQLKLAGKFRDCRGIVLGGFEPEQVNAKLRLAVDELLIPEGKPILAGLSCGHTPPMLTLPMGARAFMDASRKIFGVYA